MPVNAAESTPAQKEFLKVFLNAITENAWVNPTPDIAANIVTLPSEFETKSCKQHVNNNIRMIKNTRKNL